MFLGLARGTLVCIVRTNRVRIRGRDKVRKSTHNAVYCPAYTKVSPTYLRDRPMRPRRKASLGKHTERLVSIVNERKRRGDLHENAARIRFH